MLPPAAILLRAVLLALAAGLAAGFFTAPETAAYGIAAAIFVGLTSLGSVLQTLTLGVRWFLPERRGGGLASLAALLYWGLGWLLPIAGLVAAMGGFLSTGTVDLSLLAISLASLGLAAYALLVEPRSLAVRTREVRCRDLPAALVGLRILHLSDLHFDRPGKWVERIAAEIAALRPDLICITGDLVNDTRHADTPAVRAVEQLFQQLAAPLGVYCVYGDWDGQGDEHEAITARWFDRSGVRLLEDEIVSLSIDGATLHVLGRSPPHRLPVKRNFLAELPRDGFSIVLHHFPFGALRAAEVGADLYLAGHTHGGQVRLPGIGSLYTGTRGGRDPRGERLPRRFQAGLHRLENTWVHISRGLGMRGGDAPRLRFCCRPELTLLVLQAEATAE